VAGGPGVPEELHGLAGDDGDVGFAGGAGFVADYVGGLVAVGGDLGGFVLVDWLIGLRERHEWRGPGRRTKPESRAVVLQPATAGGLDW
jgi:hypothetical protein